MRLKLNIENKIQVRYLPIEVLEALALFQLRMKWESWQVEKFEQRKETPDAVNGREEDQRATRITQEKVIKIRVLRNMSAHVTKQNKRS